MKWLHVLRCVSDMSLVSEHSPQTWFKLLVGKIQYLFGECLRVVGAIMISSMFGDVPISSASFCVGCSSHKRPPILGLRAHVVAIRESLMLQARD